MKSGEDLIIHDKVWLFLWFWKLLDSRFLHSLEEEEGEFPFSFTRADMVCQL